MRKLLIVSLSLANFCYLRVWSELLTTRPQDTFFRDHGPLPSQYLAAMCGVILFAGLLFAGCLAMRNAPRWLKSIWLAGLALVASNGIRTMLAPYLPVLRSGLFHFLSPHIALGLALTVLACGCYLIFRFNANVGRAGAMIATLLAPVVLLSFGESAMRIGRYDAARRSSPALAARFSGQPGTRVVWIIFDELDYRLSFIDRPASIAMPNMDRLCAQGLCASNAFPPADSTAISMPALIYGRELKSTTPVAADQLRMEATDGSVVTFGSGRNVFSRVRAEGLNTGVVGWYLPYCRAFHGDLTDCWWRPIENQEGWMGTTLSEALLRQPRSLLESSVFSPFGQSLVSQAHAEVFSESLQRAKQMSVDSRLGLLLIHFNIPHPPYFYSHRTGTFTRANAIVGYTDVLALVDRTFGELRDAMEKSGTWAQTAVLISADHWFRASHEIRGIQDHRVPFLLHLPADDEAVSYQQAFGTVVTADLIVAVLKGELHTHQQAAHWITQHRSQFVTEHDQSATSAQ